MAMGRLACALGRFAGADTGGGGGGGGGQGGPDPLPLSRPSIHLHTSFSLFHLDFCAFTAIRWAGSAAACCALEIIPGYLRMRRHVRVVAFIPNPPLNFLDPPLFWHCERPLTVTLARAVFPRRQDKRISLSCRRH